MPIDRRSLLANSLLAVGGAAVMATLAKPHIARAATPLTLPPLPYADDALAPVISQRTVGLHYGKHHKSYYDKLGPLTKDTPYADLDLPGLITKSKADGRWDIFNNAGQAWNHNLYWEQFKAGPEAPPAAFTAAAERDFGGFDQLKAKMVEQSDKVFGTGWVWLVKDGDKLAILGLKDAGNPIAESKTPLAGIDVWEHAYYLDYENRRTEHVKTVLDKLVNWKVVGERMAG